MTPPCCTRAWAKATGRGPLFIHGGAWAVRNEEPYGADGPVSWVPKPTSAEWLKDIFDGADEFAMLITADGWLATMIFGSVDFVGTGSDRYRALCSALNGSPCERKAA